MGSRWRGWQALYLASSPRNREIARKSRWQCVAPLLHQRRAQCVGGRSRDWAKSGQRRGARGEKRERDGQSASRRYFGYRYDRPRLGTCDETRRRHCYQPWRAHLPRGDYCARTGHSCGGGLRRCHQPFNRWRGSNRILRRRRYGLHLFRLAGSGSGRSFA